MSHQTGRWSRPTNSCRPLAEYRRVTSRGRPQVMGWVSAATCTCWHFALLPFDEVAVGAMLVQSLIPFPPFVYISQHAVCCMVGEAGRLSYSKCLRSHRSHSLIHSSTPLPTPSPPHTTPPYPSPPSAPPHQTSDGGYESIFGFALYVDAYGHAAGGNNVHIRVCVCERACMCLHVERMVEWLRMSVCQWMYLRQKLRERETTTVLNVFSITG